MPDLIGLTTNGPIARTVRDAALLLDVMTGNRPGDMYTLPAPDAQDSFLAWADRAPGSLRIGRFIEPVVPGTQVHPDVVAAYEHASRLLDGLGHQIVDVPPLFTPDVVPLFETYWGTMACLQPVAPEDEGRLLPLTRHLRERGRQVTAPDYLLTQALFQLILRAVLPVMDAYDAVLSPTVSAPPVPVGYFTESGDPAEEFELLKKFAPYPAMYNVAGLPSVNVPLYWNADDLPIGVMLAGRMGAEGLLISLSAQLEQAAPWSGRKSPIFQSA